LPLNILITTAFYTAARPKAKLSFDHWNGGNRFIIPAGGRSVIIKEKIGGSWVILAKI
jgi:hypothetical protein